MSQFLLLSKIKIEKLETLAISRSQTALHSSKLTMTFKVKCFLTEKTIILAGDKHEGCHSLLEREKQGAQPYLFIFRPQNAPVQEDSEDE